MEKISAPIDKTHPSHRKVRGSKNTDGLVPFRTFVASGASKSSARAQATRCGAVKSAAPKTPLPNSLLALWRQPRLLLWWGKLRASVCHPANRPA